MQFIPVFIIIFSTLLGFLEEQASTLAPPSFGPRREKTCIRGFRQGEVQTSLLSYRD